MKRNKDDKAEDKKNICCQIKLQLACTIHAQAVVSLSSISSKKKKFFLYDLKRFYSFNQFIFISFFDCHQDIILYNKR